MPILFVTGEKDTSTPEEHQRILYKKVKGKKEFHVIQGSEHTFRSPEELAEIKKILGNWLDQIS